MLGLTVDGSLKSWEKVAPVEVGSLSHYIFFRVSYIPGGARFLPSTVCRFDLCLFLCGVGGMKPRSCQDHFRIIH